LDIRIRRFVELIKAIFLTIKLNAIFKVSDIVTPEFCVKDFVYKQFV